MVFTVNCSETYCRWRRNQGRNFSQAREEMASRMNVELCTQFKDNADMQSGIPQKGENVA